jgi:hypothetical protein
MVDVADQLATLGIRYAVVGAMAAAVHGLVRASLDADAVVALQVPEARSLRQSFVDAGYHAELRVGDVDDPIAGLIEVTDRHGNRVDLLIGLRGMDPEAMNRTTRVALAGGPVDLADARTVLEMDRSAADLDLLRRLASRYGGDTLTVVEALIGGAD